MEKLFGFVENQSKKSPDVLMVSYDEDFGFPRSILLDQKESWSDDELEVKVVMFEVTKKEL